MEVKIKKLNEDAVIPAYAKDGDACVDLVATSRTEEKNGEVVAYGTGLAIEVPKGHVALLFPRSSVSKTDLSLCNSVGVIDSGYRGEIIFKYNRHVKQINTSSSVKKICTEYSVGDRVGQLMIVPIPEIQFVVAEELSETERGDGGFGSTGK